MLTLEDLDPDQCLAYNRLYSSDFTLLYAGMGAGKTVITLSAIAERLAEGLNQRILITAPLSVCNSVWSCECDNWEHLQELKGEIGIATGSKKNKVAVINSGCKVVVINHESLSWLFDNFVGSDFNFDGLVIDELSKFKAAGSSRVKRMRGKLKKFSWRVGMTGTPVSEDYLGLYAQALMVDAGAALGTNFDSYRWKYFYPTDYKQYNWELNEGGSKDIADALKHILHVVPDYRGSLPALHDHTVYIDSENTEFRSAYQEIVKSYLLEVESGTVVAANAAVLTGKLQQLANGFLYVEDSDERIYRVHDEKGAYAEAWLSGLDAPVVIVYQFAGDLEILRGRFPDAEVLKTGKNFKGVVERWCAGEIPILLLHPKSAGHGLNLAAGGCHMMFFSPLWSRDQTLQTIARLWRRGQTEEVTVWTLAMLDTVDELIIERVERKGDYESAFNAHIKGCG